jgi:hypothetical protein
MSAVLDAVLTAVMVVTPTAMYIAFWRGLMRLRDDELVNRIDARLAGDAQVRGGERPAALGFQKLDRRDLDPELDSGIYRRVERRQQRVKRCGYCGTMNGGGDQRCLACEREL